MFYTFQGAILADKGQDKAGEKAGEKPAKGVHACTECKRRKIRCDGKQPCQRCLTHRASRCCVYIEHRQRLLPSRKTLESLSQSLEESQLVLRRLFPNHNASSLVALSRKELCDLLATTTEESAADGLSAVQSSMPSPCPSHLEQMPTQDSEWDEERRERDPLPVEADDVNALSLTVDRQASYLGASSIKAALMVMLQIEPQFRASLAAPPKYSAAERASSLAAACPSSYGKVPRNDNAPIPWTCKGQTCVDAYFKRIHVFTPMLDEVAFRADYLSGQKRDAPWLSLLNMVLAMGSIMATKSSDLSHVDFYHQAIAHLDLSALGSSHLETVQALILLGGFYLHYVNRPNMANAITGATLRMATALGLHREPLMLEGSEAAVAETRRRTWWSLFCVDACAATTLGRPSFGRWCPAINLRTPKISSQDEEHDAAQHAGVMPLLENIKFCKIATQIQDKLATSPLLATEDRDRLDGLLVDWFRDLPRFLGTADPCPEPLNLSRCILKWRYWNLRMLLHRPVFLTLASKGKGKLPQAKQDIAAVELCQELASKAIDSIRSDWTQDQMSGWNAVWYLYQAAMIPLTSIMWQPESPSAPEWIRQIVSALEAFENMRDWSLTARRSRDVVRRIFEAACQQQGADSNQTSTASSVAPSGSSSGGEQNLSNIGAAGVEVRNPSLNEPTFQNMADMLGHGHEAHDWLWDPQVLYWEEQTQPMAEYEDCGFDDGMPEIGYL